MSYSFGGWENDLDRFLTEDPRDNVKPVCTCALCENGIFDGEKAYRINGNVYCTDCVEEFTAEAEEI